MDTLAKSLADAVQVLRLEKHWSYEQLAARAGLDVAVLLEMFDGGPLDLQVALSVAGALGTSLEELDATGSKGSAQRADSSSGYDADARFDEQAERIRRLVVSSSQNGMMSDPREYLRRLNRRAEVLRREGSSSLAVKFVTREIRRFCLSSEQFLALAATERAPGASHYFSCSSLVDHGPTEYLADPGWLLLLRSLGRARRKHGGRFVRIFFVNSAPLSNAEQDYAMRHIIRIHLESGVEVMIVPQQDLDDDLLPKRNMAIFGGGEMLHATDQVSWDLDYSKSQGELKSALQRHQEMQRKTRLWLRPEEDFSGMALRWAGEIGPSSSQTSE